MGKKRNWDKLRKRDLSKTAKYRDVYEDQQLERSEIGEKASMTSRRIFIFIITLFVMGLAYFIFSIGEMATTSLQSFSDSTTTESSGFSSTGSGDSGSGTDYGLLPGFKEVVTANGVMYEDENGTIYTYDEYDELRNSMISDDSTETKTDDVVADETPYDEQTESSSAMVLTEYMKTPTLWKMIFTFAIGLVFFGIMEQVMRRNLEAQNLMNDPSDINQYQNDQHIALPEEIQRKFDYFPDVGAHSSVQVSSMISHMMLKNKGLKKAAVARRAETDVISEDGEIEYYKGEPLLDDDGEVIFDMMPMIDTAFAEDLFEASGMPKDKTIRKYYDTTTIEYNPGNKNRDKIKDCNTVADLINKDWIFPEYEPQRPAGAYIVDTDPVNTMV